MITPPHCHETIRMELFVQRNHVLPAVLLLHLFYAVVATMNAKMKKRQASLDAFFASKTPPWTVGEQKAFTETLIAEKKRAEEAILGSNPFSAMFRK